MAAGCGMRVQDFWDSTLSEVVNYILGVKEYEKEQTRQAWNIARWQTTIILNLFVKDKIKPTDLLEFEDEKAPELSEEEKWRRFDEFYAKVDAKKKRGNG